MEETKTTFENKCSILAELWMSYRFDKKFEDFISYNDMGLPLSFFITEDLVKPSAMAKTLVEESFDVLLAAMSVEDAGFESLDDLFVG